jgi:hypothetical protein
MSVTVYDALNWSSIIAGFLSGALWLYAARINVPTNIGSGFGALVGVEEMTAGFRKQAVWNSWAAVATAIAALLQAAGRVAGLLGRDS